MSTTAAPLSQKNILEKVAARRALINKQSSDGATPTDPTNQGTTSIPKQPDAENSSATGSPPSGNTNADNPPLTDSKILAETQPSQSGAGHVPSTQSGNALESGGTAALDKSANFLKNVSSVVAQRRAELNAKSAGAAPAPAAAPAHAAAPAAASDMDVKQANELFRQIGALVSGDEEGRTLVNRLIVKQAGINQAQQMLHDTAMATEVYAKFAAAEHERNVQAAADQQYYDAQLASLPPGAQQAVIKLAGFLQKESANFTHPDDYFWYCKGAAAGQDMAAMAGGDPAMMAGGAPPEGGMPPEGGAPQLPGGDGTPTPEDVMEMLEALVQSGQITPEQAQELMTQLAQEMGGGGGEGAPPTDAPPAEAPPEEKAASAARIALGADVLAAA